LGQGTHALSKGYEFLAQKSIQMIKQSPYLPDLAQVAFFLFPKIKNKLAGISTVQESHKRAWEGVVRFLKKDYITKVFQRRQERFETWIYIGVNYINKSYKYIFL
jgi:hypothetical protein